MDNSLPNFILILLLTINLYEQDAIKQQKTSNDSKNFTEFKPSKMKLPT